MKISFQGQSFETLPKETVLECLERNGTQIPNSCRIGICLSCVMKVTEGEVSAESQKGLKDTLQSMGAFLACSCVPETDISIDTLDHEATTVTATVEGKDLLNEQIIRLRLRAESPFEFNAGQFLSLIRSDGLVRPYSIASLPEDGFIELHVRHFFDGKMTHWIRTTVQVGDHVSIRGPNGYCFYQPGSPDQQILLCGTGTGLAPLYGVAHDALKNGHRADIHLFHGALVSAQLYCVKELESLSESFENFHYHPCVLAGTAGGMYKSGKLDDIIKNSFNNLDGWRVFVCGDPDIVAILKKKVFLAGASLSDIYSDAFITSAINNVK